MTDDQKPVRMTKIDGKPPKGTFDLWGDKARTYELLESKARRLASLYGFDPIVTPIFEQTELFARGIGEATDIVQKEMYTFLDKADRSLTLRPEGTAPVVRAYLGNQDLREQRPLKVYYYGPMFRYERPQAGRYRQFYQFGVEVIGAKSPELDAEVIHLLYSFFDELGLRNLNLLINSMGCKDCRPPYIEKLRSFVKAKVDELCEDCKRKAEQNPLRLFDCKNEKCRRVMHDAPLLSENLCNDCAEFFSELRERLDDIGVAYTHDHSLVRGFDYYTGTTFEIQSGDLGAQNALGGGGRYDDLIEEYGGGAVPAIGFALGMERLVIALEKIASTSSSTTKRTAFLVLFGSDETETKIMKQAALKVLLELRASGVKIDTDHTALSVKAQLKSANRAAANLAVIQGPEEAKDGIYSVKDMETGEQHSVPSTDLSAFLIKAQAGEKTLNDV